MSGPADKNRLPSFAADLDTILVLHDPETGAILDANPAAVAAYGYPLETLRGREVDLLSADSSMYSHENARQLIKAASEGENQRFEWQIKRACGELRWIDVVLQRIYLDELGYVLAEVTDVTVFKRQTERVGLLHRIVRHDLRNDMNVVRGHAEQLRETLNDEAERDLAVTISDVADGLVSMADVITDLAALATHDAADFRPVDVNQMVEEVATEYAAAYPNAVVTADTEMPLELLSDGRFRLALEQAVENALVHHDGVPRVAIRTTIEDVGSRAVVQIVDDGPSIPSNERAVVNSAQERSPLNHGTGMGLFLMWWCAESLGGKMEIEPTEERGNVVAFTLPVIADAHGEPEATEVGPGSEEWS